MEMILPRLLFIVLLGGASLITGCASQADRTSRLERRQDSIDARTTGRQERWQIRGEREDARAKARFDAM